MLPAAPHLDELVGPVGRFVLDVVDQGVEVAGAANQARHSLTIGRRRRGKDHRLNAKKFNLRQRSAGGKSSRSRSYHSADGRRTRAIAKPINPEVLPPA